MRRVACLLVLEWAPGAAPRDVLEVALAHSPRVEEGGPGLVYLDVIGLRALFGGEAEIGRSLVRVAAGCGFRAQVGIAGSRLGARIACHQGSGVTVVEPGGDATYLESAPLSFLDLSEEMAARLSRWGIRTLGDLAVLPTTALFERLGSEGLRLQRLARGEDPRPLQPWELPPTFEESVELEWVMETLEPLNALLADLAERVCGKLAERGLSADRVEWACRLADRTTHAGGFSPAFPTADGSTVTALLRASLESQPPRGGVEAITLRAYPVRVPPAQESLGDRSRPSPRLLTATLARLAAVVGAQRIGVPVLLDSYRPDAAELRSYSPSDPGRERGGSGPQGRDESEHCTVLALRRLRPPLPASVKCDAGRPAHVRSDRLVGAVVIGAGPWRSSGEWWAERPWIHDEWDVELADGTLCRLAHDGSVWWLEGIYD